MVDGSRHIPIGMDEGGCRRELAVCGPLCRYAEDLPLMLKALAPEAYKDMKIDQPLELEDLQVYYIPHLNGYDKEPVDGEIVNRLYDVVRFLEMDAGMRSERVHFPEMDNIFNIWMAAMDAPGYPKIAEYITNQKYKVNLLTELFKAFAGRSEHTVAAIYGGISEEYPPFNDEGREKLLGDLRKLRSKVHKLLANNAVLVFPGWNTPAPYHNKPLLTPFNVSYTSVWNAMSTPVVAVPLGLNSDGLPIACQVVGAPKSERVLISVAQKLEQKFGGWVPPQ
ncbi:hypothetical protein L596_027045 [Steinernema carpocapsae]|uniref:Amidase domain-containing protein n=1 Tax=Steinernema carpocapsae TaxID=34508 RepID=A0A4U5M428_STECR|nr:hypothetical protein L596_027045 [Steinernema carpocapsae]